MKPQEAKPKRVIRRCDVPECERKHASRGLCRYHYNQVQIQRRPKSGWKPKKKPPNGRPACVIPECEDPVVAKVFCDRHYHRIRYWRLSDEERQALLDKNAARQREETLARKQHPRWCRHCNELMSVRKRADAIYCSVSCLQAANTKRWGPGGRWGPSPRRSRKEA